MTQLEAQAGAPQPCEPVACQLGLSYAEVTDAVTGALRPGK